MNDMNPLIAKIRNCIEAQLDIGYRNFIIFPYGEIGMQTKFLLNNAYGIQEKVIIDNHLCKFNDSIKSIDYLNSITPKGLCVILASINESIYKELKDFLLQYFTSDQIAELDLSTHKSGQKFERTTIEGNTVSTTFGKYTNYGQLPQAYHEHIESIGNFSSIAYGVDVVGNHPLTYVTTHAIIYAFSPNLDTPHI